jgi:hypothetical protein
MYSGTMDSGKHEFNRSMKVVSRTFASWNHIDNWLKRLIARTGGLSHGSSTEDRGGILNCYAAQAIRFG